MFISKAHLGEYLGTFILVFIGCGSVATAVIYGIPSSLLGVAIIWGLGVAAAIFASRSISPAHLNPAVSLGFCLMGAMEWKKLPSFIVFQFLGALSAAGLLYVLFSSDLALFETAELIQRGASGSEKSAMMFGEFFPNPSYADSVEISVYGASFMEGIGTFLLVLSILLLVRIRNLHKNILPFLIGLVVTLIICLVAPYTQAGLNPARDLGPRLIAYITGWGDAAFPKIEWSFFTVYVFSPMLGALLASLIVAYFSKRNIKKVTN